MKGHLLRHVSWALGEAGWWPDFPTTAELSTEFVYKGGAQPVDGTIALDLQFVEALLQMLGPITVKEYGITVSAETLSELTLEQTRDERTVPGAPGKSFLSFLAKDLIERLFATSNEEWVELVKLLDRMARERHLQLHFFDPALQSIVEDYGFDGRLLMTEGDFIHLTDTSLQSTKLNLILDNKMAVNVAVDAEGTARHDLKWTVHNPFPKWQAGRDPRLVRALMLQGVYGSYLRLYAPKQGTLPRLNLDGVDVGAGRDRHGIRAGRLGPILHRPAGQVGRDRLPVPCPQRRRGARERPARLPPLHPEAARHARLPPHAEHRPARQRRGRLDDP